ncbi:MAG: hypothetical protein A3B99_01510 [Candidatus Yanofskybacteria bacterium RIFCSPHIGHO2_02_FULL_44_12b]|nr:MAG: hypothetical protein UW79_C0030G0009 [Candidatus Yanofskybacteria bacterium GW2011_GWA2_44_9]OGN14010.1 MAG: hypothetical protein A3B99_01510 [Candidatus Yanofskybacteria bacterium RIFCSPHIGHO2_02_FULL_44_12b]
MDGVKVPKVRTLEGFGELSEGNGLMLSSLSAGTILLLETTFGTLYRLLVLDPKAGKIRLSSENCDTIRNPAEGRLTGSTFGGAPSKIFWKQVGLIREGWIGAGMCIEVYLGDFKFFTSDPIKTISFVSLNPPNNTVN